MCAYSWRGLLPIHYRASQCVTVPDAVSLLDAAALPEALFTVWHNVFQRCGLSAGESVLIHGGASGIGTMAIQMAKIMGATIYATAGTDDKCALCEQLGATKAVNYKTGDFETELPPVDVILDMAVETSSKRISICLRPMDESAPLRWLEVFKLKSTSYRLWSRD